MSRTGTHTSGAQVVLPASSAICADSASQQAAERSAALPYPLYGTADSLRVSLRRAGAAENGAAAQPVPAERVFGPQSEAAIPVPTVSGQAQSLTDNAVFQGFVLVLAAAYALLLYFNMDNIRALLSRITRDTASGNRFFENTGGSGFTRFQNATTAIGMLLLGMLAVKYGDALIPEVLLGMLPHSAVLALNLLATAICAGVILYQWAAMRITGAIIGAQPFVAQLQLLRRIYFSLAVIVISPTLLLFTLCPRGTGKAWFILIVIELAVTVCLYLRETLNLFLSKKISILHWFLYLCIVEMFPISFLWLIAVR